MADEETKRKAFFDKIADVSETDKEKSEESSEYDSEEEEEQE